MVSVRLSPGNQHFIWAVCWGLEYPTTSVKCICIFSGTISLCLVLSLFKAEEGVLLWLLKGDWGLQGTKGKSYQCIPIFIFSESPHLSIGCTLAHLLGTVLRDPQHLRTSYIQLHYWGCRDHLLAVGYWRRVISLLGTTTPFFPHFHQNL